MDSSLSTYNSFTTKKLTLGESLDQLRSVISRIQDATETPPRKLLCVLRYVGDLLAETKVLAGEGKDLPVHVVKDIAALIYKMASYYLPILEASFGQEEPLIRWVSDRFLMIHSRVSEVGFLPPGVDSAEILIPLQDLPKDIPDERMEVISPDSARKFSNALIPERYRERVGEEMCVYCWEEGEKLLWCSGCRQVRYCDKDCQTGDWRNHKEACKRWQKKGQFEDA